VTSKYLDTAVKYLTTMSKYLDATPNYLDAALRSLLPPQRPTGDVLKFSWVSTSAPRWPLKSTKLKE